MSLSNSDTAAQKPGKVISGKIIMGAKFGRSGTELTVDDLQAQKNESLWTPEVEKEYMARVAAKAAAKAKEVLLQAQAEAEEIKIKAHEDGYAQGIAQAQEQLEQAHQEMSDSLSQALASVHEGRVMVWENHRNDIVALLRLVVEKALGLLLTQERFEILSGFMDQAMDVLDQHNQLVLRVNSEDEATMNEMLNMMRNKYPMLDHWQIKADPNMHPGGLVVETTHGMVDNSMEGRMTVIGPVLDELTLSFDEQEG